MPGSDTSDHRSWSLSPDLGNALLAGSYNSSRQRIYYRHARMANGPAAPNPDVGGAVAVPPPRAAARQRNPIAVRGLRSFPPRHRSRRCPKRRLLLRRLPSPTPATAVQDDQPLVVSSSSSTSSRDEEGRSFVPSVVQSLSWSSSPPPDVPIPPG